MLGTPEQDRRPGRAVPMTAETPDLIADLGEILDVGPDEAVDVMNRLAEFGWYTSRLPEDAP